MVVNHFKGITIPVKANIKAKNDVGGADDETQSDAHNLVL